MRVIVTPQDVESRVAGGWVTLAFRADAVGEGRDFEPVGSSLGYYSVEDEVLNDWVETLLVIERAKSWQHEQMRQAQAIRSNLDDYLCALACYADDLPRLKTALKQLVN